MSIENIRKKREGADSQIERLNPILENAERNAKAALESLNAIKLPDDLSDVAPELQRQLNDDLNSYLENKTNEGFREGTENMKEAEKENDEETNMVDDGIDKVDSISEVAEQFESSVEAEKTMLEKSREEHNELSKGIADAKSKIEQLRQNKENIKKTFSR